MTPNLLVAALIAVASFFLLRRLFGGGAGRIAGPDARTRVEAGALLLDVRSPAEFQMGKLPGATNIPVHALGARIDELDPARPIVVYCRSGARSSRAASMLRGRGFEVHDLGPAGAW